MAVLSAGGRPARVPQRWAVWLVNATLLGVAVAGAGVVVHGIVAAVRYRYVYPHWDMILVQSVYFHQPPADFWILADNEHIPIFAMPFFWLDIVMFGSRGEVLQALLLLLAAALALMFARQVARAARDPGLVSVAACWMVAALMFWLENWQNLTWDKQLHMYLSLGAFVAAGALSAAPRPPTARRAAYVAALLTVSTFSFAYGIVAWVSVLCVAALRRWPRRLLLPLCAAFAACLLAYALLYNRRTFVTIGNPADSLSHLRTVAGYVWNYLAAPVIYLFEGLTRPSKAVDAGRVVTVVVFAAAAWRLLPLRRRPPTEAEAWAMLLILFTLGTALISALGRATRFGGMQPLTSRYVVAQVPFWVGLLLLFLEGFGTRVFLRRVAVACVGTIVMAGMVASQARALAVLREANATHYTAIMSLVSGVEDRDLINTRMFPNPHSVYELNADLRARGASVYGWPEIGWIGKARHEVFRDAAARACDGRIDTVTPVAGSSGFLLQGWAWDDEARAPVDWIVLVDDRDVIRALGHGGHERPDVSQALREAGARYTGWRGYFTTKAVRAYAVVAGEGAACALGDPS